MMAAGGEPPPPPWIRVTIALLDPGPDPGMSVVANGDDWELRPSSPIPEDPPVVEVEYAEPQGDLGDYYRKVLSGEAAESRLGDGAGSSAETMAPRVSRVALDTLRGRGQLEKLERFVIRKLMR